MPSKAISNPRGLADIPFQLPAVTPAAKARARRVADALNKHYPDAYCELNSANAHELLIATILSAQATDVGVNKATPALFERFPTPADYAAATPAEIEPFIKTIGLFRNKAKSVHAAMTTVVNDFNGQVPRTMAELLTLRGVARKTANVVLGNAFDTQVGFVVDTHIARLAWRLGLIEESQRDNPVKIEKQLMALLPRDRWCKLSHQFIFHGRQACPARSKHPCTHPICKAFGTNCPGGAS